MYFLQIFFDSAFYGRVVAAPLNIIAYNIFTSHGPDLYGTEPWHFYILNGILNFNVVFLLSLVAWPGMYSPFQNLVYRAGRLVIRKVLKTIIWGVPPGLWAATVATYCPSRPGELPKFLSSKPCE